MERLGIAACECNGKYIFVSYAHDDAEYVSQIVKKLVSRGIRIWYDEGIYEGKNWITSINTALNSCGAVVAFVSRAFVNSEYCYSEMAMGQHFNCTKIPVVIEETEISEEMRYVISSTIYVNQYLNNNIDQIVDILLTLIDKAYTGQKVDSQISAMQMAENINTFLKNENWNMALEESNKFVEADYNNYMGWLCKLKTLTHNNYLVACVHSNNAIGFDINESEREKIKESYRKAYDLSEHDDNERNIVQNQFIRYRDNFDIVKKGISDVNSAYDNYINLYNHTNKLLVENEVPRETVSHYVRSFILYFITSIIEAFLFMMFSNSQYSFVTNILVFTIIVTVVSALIAGYIFSQNYSEDKNNIDSIDKSRLLDSIKIFKVTYSPISFVCYFVMFIRSKFIDITFCVPLRRKLLKTQKNYENLYRNVNNNLSTIIFFTNV